MISAPGAKRRQGREDPIDRPMEHPAEILGSITRLTSRSRRVHGPFSSTRIPFIPYSFLSVAPVFAGTPAGTRPTGRAAGSDGPAPKPRAGVRAVTARERGGPAWSGRRPGVRDADARHVISVTRRYAVGRRGALSRGSRPHTSHWGPYRCPRTMFTSRAAEPQRIRRRGSSILLAISSTCFAVRRPRRRPAPTVTRRPTVPDGIAQWNSRRRADITWAADPLRGPRSTRHRRSTCL